MPDLTRRRSTAGAVRATVALVLAVLALALAIWIVAPPPMQPFLPLAVGAPEVSHWLSVHALLALIAARTTRQYRRSRVAMPIAVCALLLSLTPLIRFPFVAAHARQDLVAAFGADVMTERPGFRGAPLTASALFGGIRQRDALSVRPPRSEMVAVVAGDTLTVEIHRPVGRGPFPIIVQIYGGAWRSGTPHDFAEFARYMAAEGYVVFAIDYRHAPAFRFPAQRDDITTALTWIAAHAAEHDADAGRAVLLGRSAGAHLALLAAYAPHIARGASGTPSIGGVVATADSTASDASPEPSLVIRGVVSYYGPVDLAEGWQHPPSPDPLRVRGIEEAFLGGVPANVPDAYRTASPITYVRDSLPPTLLLYGGRDHVVEARFGRMLHAQLQRAGVRSVLIELPWAEHAFDAVPNGPSGQLSRWATERFIAAVTR